MPTEERIRRAVDGLKSVYPLRSVRIFGSYAERRAAANSDLDSLVEFDAPAVSLVKRNAPKKKRTRISAGSCGADDQIRTGDLILTNWSSNTVILHGINIRTKNQFAAMCRGICRKQENHPAFL